MPYVSSLKAVNARLVLAMALGFLNFGLSPASHASSQAVFGVKETQALSQEELSQELSKAKTQMVKQPSINIISTSEASGVSPPQAKTLFEKLKHQVFQIRIIEVQSGEKSTIGSGFLVSDEGLIMSNYHVISLHVNKPDKYRVELVMGDGSFKTLTLLDLDVVNDLALLAGGPKRSDYLQLRSSELEHGARVFALGNPRDLGMTVVEGNYNGYLATSLHKKILISGSVNPGMSGGPAVDVNGELIGVNVATQGNQIGFLVSVEYARNLLDSYHSLAEESASRLITASSDSQLVFPLLDPTQRIADQLYANQELMTQALLKADWPVEEFGGGKVPGAATEFFKCWGNSQTIEKALFEQTHKQCFTEDRIYLRAAFDTGLLVYSFSWYRTEEVNQLRFYNQFEKAYEGAENSNQVTRDDVGAYNCKQEFINRQGNLWRGVLCARPYLKYPKLFDVAFVMASLFEEHEGLIVEMSMSGVNKTNGILVLKKLLGQTQWN